MIIYIKLNNNKETCTCSDELDPYYAEFLATYNPSEFEEEFCKCHSDYVDIVGKINYSLKSLSWQFTLSESNVNSPSVLINFI